MAKSLDHSDEMWEAVYKRLLYFARQVALGMPDVFEGSSPKDLVQETLVDFFRSPNALGWDRERDLGAFLCGVLKNRFLVRLRRSRKIAGSLDDGSFVSIQKLDVRRQVASAAAQVEVQDLRERLVEVLGDKSLAELIEASASLEDVHNLNQWFATELGISVDEVVNRRKRLRRALSRVPWIKEIYGQLVEKKAESSRNVKR